MVGGPVQPERPCYVERAADRRLDEALRAKRLCCVLGPRAIGKSSLLQRAARALRAAGALGRDGRSAAASPSSAATTPDGWLRRIAERVAAELELGVDVGAWWGARDAVAENRLVEFFWEVVLTNTTAPDRRALRRRRRRAGRCRSRTDFLDAVGGCYARRSREPDFARLGFALAGCTSQRALAQASPDFGVRRSRDHRARRLHRRAGVSARRRVRRRARARAGADGSHLRVDRRASVSDATRRARRRAQGRPARGRRARRARATAGARRGRRGSAARSRARVARRAVAAGAPRDEAAAAGSPPAARSRSRRMPRSPERLWLSGTVRVDARAASSRIRNRIVKELVAARLAEAEEQRRRRWLAAAAVLLVALAAGGYWYTQRLPVADIETLTSAAADAERPSRRRIAACAACRVSRERADELWLEALGRQSRAATTLAAAAAADTRLRELPGQDAAADRLLSEFWLRRAREQAHAEQRDAAILLAQRAAALPAADPAAAAYLAELAGDDYSTLERSLRLAGAPEYWHMAFARRDDRVDRRASGKRCARRSVPRPARARSAPRRSQLTALEHSCADARARRRRRRNGRRARAVADRAARCRRRAARDVGGAERRGGRGHRAAQRRRRRRDVRVPSRARLAARAARRRRRARRLALDHRRSRGRQHRRVRRLGAQRSASNVARDDPPELVPIPDPQRIEAVERAGRGRSRRRLADFARRRRHASRCGISRPGSSSTTSRCRPPRAQVALDADGHARARRDRSRC